MATEPTVMKMRLAQINRIISGVPTWPDYKHLDEWEAWFERGKSEMANLIRQELSNLPKGYVRGEPSLKTQAKKRFLMWRENQAKGEWKKLSAEEQAVWEGYVTDGLKFGTIREKELAREKDFEIGDRVVLIHEVRYLGVTYPAGAGGVILFTEYNEVQEKMMYKIKFYSHLPTLNAFPNEIKKEK